MRHSVCFECYVKYGPKCYCAHEDNWEDEDEDEEEEESGSEADCETSDDTPQDDPSQCKPPPLFPGTPKV